MIVVIDLGGRGKLRNSEMDKDWEGIIFSCISGGIFIVESFSDVDCFAFSLCANALKIRELKIKITSSGKVPKIIDGHATFPVLPKLIFRQVCHASRCLLN